MKSYKILYILDAHTHLPALDPIKDRYESEELGICIDQLSTGQLDAEEEDNGERWMKVETADFIIVGVHGSFSFFRSLESLWERFGDSKPIFVHGSMEDELAEILPRLRMSQADYSQIYKYYSARTQENVYQLGRYLAQHFGGMDIEVEEPHLPQWEGIYSDSQSAEIGSPLEQAIEAHKQGKPVVGILLHYRLYEQQDLAHINALVNRLQSLGACCIPVYTTGSIDARTGERGVSYAINTFFYKDGLFLPEVLINTIGYSLGIFEHRSPLRYEDGTGMSPLTRLGVPVIQAYHTYFSYEQWRESIQGLDAFALVSSIYYPEFDGQIDGYAIGCREYCTERSSHLIAPIAEGVDVVTRLAMRWIKLRRKPHEQKHVAIIFHNMPARNDMIGCAAGLDSPASVYNLLTQLQEMGIAFDHHYKDGDDIIRRIIDGLTNETDWLTDEEVLNRAVAGLPVSVYQTWYERLASDTKSFVEKDWGEAPGTFKVLGDKMPVPGILNGNIFIGLQPPRGYAEHAEEVYHSTDISCPHYYIALYKWIKYIFEADAVIHIGTHGTLEWLPGKEKALSQSCLPQVNIGDLPHLYLYHTSVIGEGVQAKRRSAAVLLNHLEPVSVESGVYDELAALDDLVTKYVSSPLSEKQKQDIAEQIIVESERLHLDQDLSVAFSHRERSTNEYVTDLHKWLGVIKQSYVKDGLHIYGLVPESDRLRNFIRVLVRLPNEPYPSFNEALCSYLGYEYETIRLSPESKVDEMQTGIMVLDRLTSLGTAIVEAMEKQGYTPLDKRQLEEILGEAHGASTGMEDLMKFISQQVYPKLCATTQEIDEFVNGIKGHFVRPGKGGSPSRGNIEILPTGKNMYAIDPTQVPSRAAYRIGSEMGQKLLDRYLRDEGTYPESIAIVLYAGDQMRTYGEDIAEILWLMGVRPKWFGSSTDKVIGIEVIPIEDLGRPRIDVVSRISGLLRDTFPNIIHLLDEAAKAVAIMEESHEQNFIRKHFDEDMQAMLNQGIDPNTASQEALVRVFGCPPGNYGGGVDILIEAKNWQSDADLGAVAITWGAHAYSKEIHGAVSKANFERQLSKVQVTVKNENTIDFDLFDIDDEFIYHGGLIAAVKKCSGQSPRSYYGNSSDPSLTQVRSVQEESARIMRSRLLNPIWIEGLKRHGYKGAQDVAYNMDNVFGWDATSDIVEDWNYEALAEHLLQNEENRTWLQAANLWALREITEKLLEAAQRGMWNANPKTLQMVKDIYLNCEGLMEEGNAQ